MEDIITVSPVKDTNIVKISVQSEDSDFARKAANELTIVYNVLLKSFYLKINLCLVLKRQ